MTFKSAASFPLNCATCFGHPAGLCCTCALHYQVSDRAPDTGLTDSLERGHLHLFCFTSLFRGVGVLAHPHPMPEIRVHASPARVCCRHAQHSRICRHGPDFTSNSTDLSKSSMQLHISLTAVLSWSALLRCRSGLSVAHPDLYSTLRRV